MRGYTHVKLTNTNGPYSFKALGVTRAGIRNDGDGGWTFYAVFPSDRFTPDHALNVLEDAGLDMSGWPAYNAGQSFSSAGYARVVGSRVLVTQRGGLDI